MLSIWYVILIVQYFNGLNANWAQDVDSSIIEEIKQNPSIAYLIIFHAPWCGHCRKFESAYEEIAKEVNDLSATVDEFKNIRIVRIDATVYTSVANHYDIRGYPTIKFIRGSEIFSYENERSKPAVLEFLKRMNGPAIRWIPSVEKFDEIRREHEVFFLLVTTNNEEDDGDQLFNDYKKIVNRYLSQAYFYATNDSIIQETYFAKYESHDQSQLFVIKTEGFYLYEPDDYNNSLEEFITKEKVATFPQVAAGNMYDLVLTKKIIIIYGFNEQQEVPSREQKRNEFKTQMHKYVIKHASTLHNTFQFAWSNDLDLLNNIAVWTLEEPLLLLYDSIQRKYGIYLLSSMIDQNIESEPIFDYIISNHSQIIRYTGSTWSKRLFRPFWELYRTLMAIFIEAPFVSMLIIGLPASVLSIVCYCLCCLPNETLMDDADISYEKRKDGDDEEEDISALPITTDDQQKPIIEKKED